MFPMEFDHEVLETLPVPDEEKIRGVLQILKTVIKGRVMPYFRNKRGTDPATVARVGERISINRSEDEGNRVRIASLLSKKEDRWTIHIHERIFDYLAFVIPSDPESRLGGTTSEEGKVIALTEFLLRHQAEHMVYPKKSEREVIRSDVVFAMDRRKEDPTYYLMLRNALADEMNGLRGGPYQALFESAELERPYEYLITRILTSLVTSLANIQVDLLRVAFSAIDTDLKTKLLVEWYRRSRETSDSLIQRASYLQEVIWFFSQIIEMDEKEAEKIFHVFKDRWGLVYLFRELDLPETSLEDKEPEELFVFFKENLKKLSLGGRRPFFLIPSTPKAAAPEPCPMAAPAKSLKERIEEARNNPSFPRRPWRS